MQLGRWRSRPVTMHRQVGDIGVKKPILVYNPIILQGTVIRRS